MVIVDLRCGDCRDILPALSAESVHCVVTSPPYYGLRDYGVDGQIGLEQTPEEYVSKLVAVFREAWCVLRDDGTVWINIGDSYAGGGRGRGDKGYAGPKQATNQGSTYLEAASVPSGCKPKDLIGIPWMLAFALRADGWYLRSEIIWHKPNCMPESVTDRPTKCHEQLFLLSKSATYFYDAEAIKLPCSENTVARAKSGTWHNMEERPDVGFPGNANRNKAAINRDIREKVLADEMPKVNRRDVWTIATQPYHGAHLPPSRLNSLSRASWRAAQRKARCSIHSVGRGQPAWSACSRGETILALS